MKLEKQTILITGGSSGIGLQLAERLVNQNNTVIICGRSEARLQEAKLRIPQLHFIKADISNHQERAKLLKTIKENFAGWNVLINNAAIVHKTNFIEDDDILEKAEYEIATNLIAPIALSKSLLQHARHREQSAIINITTGLVYAPRAAYPVYNATKAAVHSFTQVLRLQAKRERTKIIEVMMPVVNTPWHKGEVPSIAISAEHAVDEMMQAIETEKEEIRVGAVQKLYILSRLFPSLALKLINNIDKEQ